MRKNDALESVSEAEQRRLRVLTSEQSPKKLFDLEFSFPIMQSVSENFTELW